VGGTFDIIHVGHIRFLYRAKSVAENSELIVIVARDKTVKKIKKREPIFNERERLEIVSALKPVDLAILGNEEGGLFEILRDIKPDIVVLGYDQQIDENKLKLWARQNGLNIRVLRLPKFYARIDSSSKARMVIASNKKD